ncbi:helix-turn-helix domain-containing protein [Ekhidna sp.]
MYLFLTLNTAGPIILQIAEQIVPLIIIMPLGPLIFFYTKINIGQDFNFKKQKLHFTSTILDLIPSMLSLTALISFLIGFSDTLFPHSIIFFNEAYEKYVDVPRWLSLSIYLVFAIKLLRKSQVHHRSSTWVKHLLIAITIFQILWLSHLIPYILPGFSNKLLDLVGWYPIYIPLTLLVYWLGINGIIQSRVSSRNTPLDISESKDIVSKLNQLMDQEQVYLNANLTLNELVNRTGIPQKKISQALNQYLGKSLNEYINEFRIEEVKEKLADSAYDHLTITGIALESGFNSQATFQRTFKSITKETPKSFRTSLK